MTNVDESAMESELAKIGAITEDLWGGHWEVEAEKIKKFPLQDGDLMITGYPKSGTNWFQVIIGNLWPAWGGLLDGVKVPNMAAHDRDGYGGYETAINGKSPRLMKLHLERFEMPDAWPDHGKVIYVTRNPKDVCVSYFHNLRSLPEVAPEFAEVRGPLDMEFHVRRFVNGDMPWGSYVDNILSWHSFDHPNLLKLTYEDARADIETTVDRIVEFVARPVSVERVKEVVEMTDFRSMSSNSALRAQLNVPTRTDSSDHPFLRKGIVGDWVSELTEEQSELLDLHVVRPLEEHGVRLTYA